MDVERKRIKNMSFSGGAKGGRGKSEKTLPAKEGCILLEWGSVEDKNQLSLLKERGKEKEPKKAKD